MSKRKNRERPTAERDVDQPWAVHVVRWLSYAALATVLIADNGSPTVSSLSKISFFQLFTGLAVAVWLSLAIFNKKYRPLWRNPIVLGSTVFMAGISLSLITSVDPYRSFWSNAYRLTGVFNYLHYWVWLLALTATHRGWNEWRPVIWASNVVAVLVNGIGIIKWLTGGRIGRITSTIDNALYLADFALLASFISAILIARSERRWVKALAAASLTVNATATLLTGSRSTAGTLFLGAALFVVWIAVTKSPKKRRIAATGVLFALALATLGALFYVRSDDGKAIADRLPFSIQRIVLTSDFGQDRAALAHIAIDAFRKRPILGWGLEHFDIAFESNYGPEGVDALLPEAWYDRAHDQFLDVLVMTGLVGFISYLVFWIAALYLPLRRLVRGESDNRDADFISLIALTCYAAALIFSFDLPGPMTWHWLLLAFIAAVGAPPLGPEDRAARESNSLAGALMTIFLIAELVLSVKPYLQARTVEAGCAASRSNPKEALQLWRDGLKTETMATPELQYRLLGCFMDSVDSAKETEIKTEIINFTDSQMDLAAKRRPYDYKTLLAAGWVKLPAKRLNIDRLDAADEFFRKAIEINDAKPRAFELMADLHGMRGDNLLKAQMLLHAADLSGNADEAAKFFARASSYYARAGETGQAMVAYMRAYRLNKDVTLENTEALPAISEALPKNAVVPEDVLTAAEEGVARHRNAAHHAARLRIFMAAAGMSQDRLNAALEETKRDFPELGELMSERLSN
jgi:O-antigen ligase